MVSIAILSTGLVGALIFLGVMLFLFSQRTKAPLALLLLLLGVFIGPITHIFKISSTNPLVHTFSIIALVIVLFEAGYGIKFYRLKKELTFVLILTSLTVFFSVLGAFIVAKLLFHLGTLHSLLLSALVASTDLTLIYPAIRNLRISKLVKESLELEATLNSIFAAVMAVVLANIISIGEFHPQSILQTITFQFILGVAIGLIIGWALLTSVRKLNPNKTPELISLGVVFVVFALAEFFGGSGIISVLVVGILFGNSKPPAPKIIKSFGGSFEVLILIFVYVLLGAVLKFSFTASHFVYALIFVLALLFSRHLAVLPLKLSTYTKKVISFSGARGLVSATLIINYAPLFPNSDLILNLGFLTIFITSISMFALPFLKSKSF